MEARDAKSRCYRCADGWQVNESRYNTGIIGEAFRGAIKLGICASARYAGDPSIRFIRCVDLSGPDTIMRHPVVPSGNLLSSSK
jgi:hypothetical protein